MNETLWLPDGFKNGTIIYDKEDNPWEAVKDMGMGTGIFEIRQVDPEYAKARIALGAQVLISKEE